MRSTRVLHHLQFNTVYNRLNCERVAKSARIQRIIWYPTIKLHFIVRDLFNMVSHDKQQQ